MRLKFITGVLFLGLIAVAKGQNPKGFVAQGIIVGGDTVPIYVMNDVRVFAPIVYKNKHDAIKYSKLIRNVRFVYPYARITAVKVKEYEEIMKNTPNEQQRKKLMKQAEDELKKQFEDDIKNMTDVQGVILIKLIYRETGNTSYDLIKEFRGKVMAVFYQTLGRLFGYNLKTTYDPQGEDKEIEKIVVMIESGAL